MGLKKNDLKLFHTPDLIYDASHFAIYKQDLITIVEDKNISPWTLDHAQNIIDKLNITYSNSPLKVLIILSDIQDTTDTLKNLIKNISEIKTFTKGSIISTWNLKLNSMFEDIHLNPFSGQWSLLSDVNKGFDILNQNKLPTLTNSNEEKLIYRTEDIYKQIINTSPAILYSCSPSIPFQLQFVSDKIEELGFDKKVILLNRNFWIDYLHQDDLSDFINSMSNCSVNENHHFLFRLYDVHGDHRWYKNSFRYIKDEANLKLWIGGVLQDVTAEVNQKNALKEQRGFLNTLLSSMTEGLCGLDLDGNIIFMNPAGCTLLGYSESELIGKNFLTLGFHLKENGEMRLFKESLLHQTIYEGKVCPSDPSVFWRKDRTELHVEFTISPLVKENHRIGAVVSFTDITEKRKAALIIETQRASMINSTKLSALGEMAGGMAHEINNPLAGIQGKVHQLLRMIDSGKFDVEKFKSDLKKVYETSERIATIIKGLKAFSRNADKDPFEIINTQFLVDQILIFTKERFKNYGVNFEVSSQLSKAPFQGRSTQLVQVLISLINNSYDAILHLNEKWIKIETQEIDGRLLQLIITDSGLSIKPEIAQKMMQPFFTTKGIGKGVGLGLSVASGIISDHGGRFYFDESHKHTRFIIELPIVSNNKVSGNKL